MTIPQPAQLLLDFVNTIDVEPGTDALGTTSDLITWLRQNGLLNDPAAVHDDDLRAALKLRTQLRSAMTRHHESAPDEEAHPSMKGTDTETLRFDLHVNLHDGGAQLVPAGKGVRAALARIAAAVVAANADGTWSRLKICPATDCQWAFVDRSKNASRTWCSMRVCGNRRKTRAYRGRQRAAQEPAPSHP
jgi:predicted RNA-binding Zn ribbon-like protein